MQTANLKKFKFSKFGDFLSIIYLEPTYTTRDNVTRDVQLRNALWLTVIRKLKIYEWALCDKQKFHDT